MIQDIRIAVSLRGHPKRAKLEMLLGPGATGHLLDLWIIAAMTHPDGVLRGLDAWDVALMANWHGKAEDFTTALLAVRFMGQQPDGTYYLHDWNEHQAWVVGHGERSAKGRKAIAARWERERAGRFKDGSGAGPDRPEVRKMPEAGPKNGETVHPEYSANTPSIPTVIPKLETSNTPLPSSSSTLQEDRIPPVTPVGVTSPAGGAPQEHKRFIPPSIEELRAYCAERGNGLDAEHIHAHYTANGWKVGRNPMRDWRAAVRTWESRSRQEQRAQATRASQSPAALLLAKHKGATQ